MNLVDLAAQRAASIEELKELHLQRGRALLDGDESFSDTGIAHLESRVAAISTAAGIQVNRDREAEAERQKKVRFRLATELHGLEVDRLECVAAADVRCQL